MTTADWLLLAVLAYIVFVVPLCIALGRILADRDRPAGQCAGAHVDGDSWPSVLTPPAREHGRPVAWPPNTTNHDGERR